MEKKLCTACKKNKHREEFYTQIHGNKGYPTSWCKRCYAGRRVYDQTYHKKYAQEYRKRKPLYYYNYVQAVKNEVFSHYSDGKLKCNCCKEKHLDFLCIDHIWGGGNKHRREHNGMTGVGFWLWLKRNNYPKGFQVLCYNCNFAKGHTRNRICPHKKK